MKIFVNDIRLYARHGVMPQERAVGGWFTVSVIVETDDTRSQDTDELADTVNYAELVAAVQEEMAIPGKLLEHVAKRIGDRLLSEHPRIARATLRLTKDCPPLGVECRGAGVEITLERE